MTDTSRITSPFARFGNPHLAQLLELMKLDRRFVRGEGNVLIDEDGNRYLDFLSGFGAVPLGHNHPELVAALERYTSSGEPSLTQPSDLVAAGELAERLVSMTPRGLDRVFFANSGAEAVEAAIKACRAATGRMRIIATKKGFHGKTLGALSATGRDFFQQPFGAPVAGFDFVPYGDIGALRCALAAEPAAAVILEPVQGEGGANVPPTGYLSAVRAACDRHGAAFILDEIQTGFGRTGTLFACQAEEVVPDALLLGKALGGGLVPIGAVVMRETLASEDFCMRHSSTFAGNSLCCRIALTVCDIFERDGDEILANVRARSIQLMEGHERLVETFPNILSGHRGRGLLLGLEFGVTRKSFPAHTNAGTLLGLLGEQEELIPLVSSHLLHRGIRTAPTLNSGCVMRVEPPLTITHEECERYLDVAQESFGILARGDTGSFAGHLMGNRGVAPASSARPSRPPKYLEPCEGEGRFAFLVHAIDANSFIDLDPALAGTDRDKLKELGNRLGDHIRPFLYGSCRIESRTGTTAYGDFYAIPLTAERMIEMDPEEARARVLEAVEMARSRGAGIVGLGGFTSIVMRGGTRAVGKGVAITTGNSYTVVSAVEAIEEACRRLGVELAKAHVGILGATGAIGAAATRMLSLRAGHLTLIGNPANPAKSRRRIRRVMMDTIRMAAQAENGGVVVGAVQEYFGTIENGLAEEEWEDLTDRVMEAQTSLPLEWSLDRASVLPDCDVVLTATSSTEPLVQPEMLKAGAIVCDLSRPSNTSRSVAVERPDVLVIDGGVVEVYNRPHLGIDFGFPCGLAYACMAETMLLGLEQHYEDTSIGIDLSEKTLTLVSDLASKHGFRLAGLRSFDRPLAAADWRRLIKARSEAGDARVRPCAAMISQEDHDEAAQEAIGSVKSKDILNAVSFLLERHAHNRPDHTALIDGERRISYAELAELVNAAAAVLLEEGVGIGDRIAFLTHDCVEVIAFVLACMRQGAVAAYLNPYTRPHALKEILSQIEPAFVLADADRITTIRSLLTADLGIRVHDPRERLQAVDRLEVPEKVEVEAGAPAICLFSSGTTGRPKAILHSHRDIINTNLNYAAEVLELDEGDVTFSSASMFFAYGFNSIHQALFAGGTAVVAPPWPKPEVLFKTLERARPTVFFSVPTVYLLMLRWMDEGSSVDLSSLRLCVSAGETLPEDIFDAWRSHFDCEIIDGIGTTEVLSTFISNRPGDIRLGATGRLVPGFTVRLMAEQGRPAKVGEIGTLWVRGNTLGRPFHQADPSEAGFEGEWFCTNDLFYRDERGWFYYVGRANDVLKVGGCWLSPGEIEGALRAHDAVREVAVVADAGVGGLVRPRAFVVLEDGWYAGPELAQQLKSFVRGKLLPVQYPHFIEFIDELPKTPTGKIMRHKLRVELATDAA